jgi:hypothetical protein
MASIAEFLLARIAEDEALADTLELCPYFGVNVGSGHTHITKARMLAECKAKLRIVELHTPFHVRTKNDGLNWDYQGCGVCYEPDGWQASDGSWWPCPTLKALGEPDADHPDYDPTWKP